MKLRPYQDRAVTEVAQLLATGKRKVIFQLATGGGKTICFSAISSRYVGRNSGKSVLILVHRKELLQQTRKTLYNAFGITAQPIQAGMRHIPSAQVYVGMVESVARRVPQLRNIGLVIIDEAHISSFNKLHQHFPDQYIIGFTATPMGASKKDPLKNHYQDIVCGVDIPELIQSGSLCQNITYSPKDIVDRAELAIKAGEFDSEKMGQAFGKAKHIKNTVTAYEKWAKGTKTIIFNCSVSHSQNVCNAFTIAGYKCRHLDGTMSGTERDNILRWFASIPDAILCNVGIATTGFDEPSIETVIMNKATLSLPLWLQCTGRGSRPTQTKTAFTIIDMGGNALSMGDWCDSRDWKQLFHNPPKAKDKAQEAPVKNCPHCDAIIPISSRTCNWCGYEMPTPITPEEQELSDFVVITKGINVLEVIQRNRDKKAYYSFFEIARTLSIAAKDSVPKMTDARACVILNEYNRLAADWCEHNRRNYDNYHQQLAKDALWKELRIQYPRWKHDQPPKAQDIIPSIAPIAPTFIDTYKLSVTL